VEEWTFCLRVSRVAKPVDGWIEASGLYFAKEGDKICDVVTVDEQIAKRTIIVGESGVPVRVRVDFAEMLARSKGSRLKQ
jgi:hypothetical protein